jgi:hypothetical protein
VPLAGSVVRPPRRYSYCELMTQSVSVPEKTLEHWSSLYLAYRYRSLASLWWPARGEDIDLRMLPMMPGKAVQLELKTTTPAGAWLHDVNVDLGQLWEYSHKPMGRQPFYAFPWPDWDGKLADVAQANHPRKEVTELAFRRSGPQWWFADWMIVLTTRQVADVLHHELNAHGSRTRRSPKRLVRFDVKNPANTIWGDPASPAAAPQVINWLDLWYELEQCGRDDWPQLIRVPWILVDRRHVGGAPGLDVYTREEVTVMLRQAADLPRLQRDEAGPLVTLEPAEDGTYRIAEELSEEPDRPEPGDGTDSAPDDNRQVVFLSHRTLFRAV